jgi:polar amino acid transport system substrate-binding protein
MCVITAMRRPGKGLGALSQPLTVEPIGVAVPASDPLLLNLVDNHLNSFEATGLVKAIRAKWLENDCLAVLP